MCVFVCVLQLLSGTSPTRNLTTPTSSLSHQIPTTPSSSRSSSWGARKRGRPFDSDESSKRRRVVNSYPSKPAGEKGHQGKGLRHFSQRVCEKVRQKGNTTYNEVSMVGAFCCDHTPTVFWRVRSGPLNALKYQDVSSNSICSIILRQIAKLAILGMIRPIVASKNIFSRTSNIPHPLLESL